MHIRPMLSSDLGYVADVAASAFGNTNFFFAIHPRQHEYPRDFRRFCLTRVIGHYLTPGKYGFVCVSDRHDGPAHWSGEEEILGYAFWERLGNEKTDASARAWRSNQNSLSAEFGRLALSLEKWYNNAAGLHKSADPEAMRTIAENFSLYEHFEHLPGCWHLCALGTAAEHQRRGVGVLLVDWGVEWARRERVLAVVLSTVAGQVLYRKKGFKAVDYNANGIPGVENQCIMVLDDRWCWTRPAEDSEKWVQRDGKTLEVDVVWTS